MSKFLLKKMSYYSMFENVHEKKVVSIVYRLIVWKKKVIVLNVENVQ